MDRRDFDHHFDRIYRDHMPQEAQRIKNRYMAVWQIPNMEKMTFCMADIINRRILDGPYDDKEHRLLSRQLGLTVAYLNPFLDVFVERLLSEIERDSLRYDTVIYRGESRPPKYAHSLITGSIHSVKSFSSFSALPSTALAFTRATQDGTSRQATLFRVLMHRGARCAYIKNAMTVRDPKACDYIFNEFEYLAGPNMSYKVIDVSTLSLGYSEVLVVSMVQLPTAERAYTGDMGTIAFMNADAKWSSFARALHSQVMQEQQMWNALRGMQTDNRIWDKLVVSVMAFLNQGKPSGKSSHLLGNSVQDLEQLARAVVLLDIPKAKLVGKKLGLGKQDWKDCEKDRWPVPQMLRDILQSVVMAPQLTFSHPMTLYVQVPVWWYAQDKPNPVYAMLSQKGRFVVDVPLIAQFTPDRQLWRSYMNLGQEPPMIACAGKRPVRENHRTIFCLTFVSIRGILPRHLTDPFQKQALLLPPFDCYFVGSEQVLNGFGQSIEMRHIRLLE